MRLEKEMVASNLSDHQDVRRVTEVLCNNKINTKIKNKKKKNKKGKKKKEIQSHLN